MPKPRKSSVSSSKGRTPSTGSIESHESRKSVTSVQANKQTSSKVDTSKSKTSGPSPSAARAASAAKADKSKRKVSSASASSAKSDISRSGKSSIPASSAKSASPPNLDKFANKQPETSASPAKSASLPKLDKSGQNRSSTSTLPPTPVPDENLVVSAAANDEVEGKEDKPVMPDAREEVDVKTMPPADLSPTMPMLSKMPTTTRSSDTRDKYTKVRTAMRAQARYRCRVASFLVATAILISVLGVALVWHLLSPETPGKHVDVCLTVDCRNFGREISSAINRSFDPCVDFHSYVCGAWDDPKRQESAEGRMKSAAVKLALREIEDDRSQQSRATQFYQSCIQANEHKEDNLKAFSELRSSIGLFWPEHKNENIHPLDVMVNLAINWDMNFLFDMSTVAMPDVTALLISRGQLDNGWELTMRNQRSPENYQDYVKQHLDVIGASDALKDITATDLLSLETAIIDAKLGFLYDVPVQKWLSLGSIDMKATGPSADLWLSCLVKHDREFNWTAESTVIIEDVKILESLQSLLMSLSHDRLLIALSWVFIQTHLWAVYGEPSIRFPGMSDELTKLKSHRCMEYVESRLGLLSIWKTMNDRFGSTADRLHVMSFLHRVHENAKSLVNGLSWIDEKRKQTAFLKLDKMTRVILPGKEFFNKNQMEELYSVFPDMAGNTFMENFLNASRVYRELRNHEHFEDIYSVRMFPRLGREAYLYLPNIMKLAFGDLQAPMFYNNATLAIRYGGIGSFAARQMVKAFDEVGITVDETGKARVWIGPAASSLHLEKTRCNMSARSGSRPLRLFPVMPGLELAFHGYVAAVARDYRALEDFKVIHLEDFTDDQIFFLTYCYTLCAKRRQTGGDECNVPLKNFPPFAAAYHCAENTPMNPPRKCSFFPSQSILSKS